MHRKGKEVERSPGRGKRATGRGAATRRDRKHPQQPKPWPWPSSCLPCRSAKVKCGGDGVHACEGCVKRYLRCVYRTGAATPTADPSNTGRNETTSEIENDGSDRVVASASDDPNEKETGLASHIASGREMDLDWKPPAPASPRLPIPEEELPQLTSESFNSYMSAWLKLPQHPAPTSARALRILSEHPLLLATKLWVGGMFLGGDPTAISSSRAQSQETYRLGRMLQRLLSAEIPRVVNDIATSSSLGGGLPLTIDNMALLLSLATVPRVLLKLGQIGVGMGLHVVGLDVVRGIGPQFSLMLMEQQRREATLDTAPGHGLPMVTSTQLSDYLVQQQWIRGVWSMLGSEMARTAIQLKSKLIASPLRDFPHMPMPVADHALMRSTFLHSGLLESVPSILWPTPILSSSTPTFGEFLKPLISDDESDFDLRREVLARYITNLPLAGPSPLRLAALYLMAMVSEFNWWLEHEAHLTMLNIILADELLTLDTSSGSTHADLSPSAEFPAIALEAVARRHALLNAFAAVNQALPAYVRALDETADISGIVAYAAEKWSPAIIHGVAQLSDSFIWLHTGQLLLRCPEPFSDKERVLVSDTEWNFWFSSSTFATASTHAIILCKYAENISQLTSRLLWLRQQHQAGVLRGLALVPSAGAAQDSTLLELAAKVTSFTPLFSYSLIYAAWLHIVAVNFFKDQENAALARIDRAGTEQQNAGSAPLFSWAHFGSDPIAQFEKNARSCIGMLSTHTWKPVDSHWKVLLRMMMLSGSGPSEDQQAELLLRKEVEVPERF